MVDTTEMSISPAMTTNVRPNASSPRKMYGVRRSSRFARWRKKLDSVALQIPVADDEHDEDRLPSSDHTPH